MRTCQHKISNTFTLIKMVLDAMFKLFLIYFCIIYCRANEYPINKVNQGVLHGKFMKTRNGNQISAYMGIPYAKPPVKDLRFKPPLPAHPWKGVLNATFRHPICPQKDRYQKGIAIAGDENCLFLNVYTPQVDSSETGLRPVMIFIHGGGFYFGTGNMYGPNYLLDENVVLVTFNYRLGALGFLTTGDEVVAGNNGLKDQSLAIKWVYSNIEAFGGNPQQITLFGEAAGGASAHLHYFSPLSQGLFSGAISQSGTAFNVWSLGDKSIVEFKSKKLASALGCTTNDHNVMVECLRSFDASKIVEMDKIFMEWDIEPFIPFKPVIEVNHEKAFLSEHPLKIMKSGKYANVPWVTGLNSNEGVIKVAAIYKNPKLVQELNEDFNRIMAVILEKDPKSFEENANKIRNFYFGDKKIDNATRFSLVDMFTDYLFLIGADTAVNLHLIYSKQPIYYYLFNHQSINSFSQIVGDPHDSNLRYGVSHADELTLLFPLEFLFNNQQNDLDQTFSNLVVTLWANFAKFGNPTPQLSSMISSKWEPVLSEDLEYFSIGGGVLTGKKLFPERIKFWKNMNIISNFGNIRDEL